MYYWTDKIIIVFTDKINKPIPDKIAENLSFEFFWWSDVFLFANII